MRWVVGGLAALALVGCDDGSGVTPGQDAETLERNLAEARAFSSYRPLWAGQAVGEHELDSIDGARGGPTPREIWGFSYGDCVEFEVEGATTCNHPISIQNESICRRWPKKMWKLTTIRGASAIYRGEIEALEVYTGGTTVVIFTTGPSRKLAFDAAEELRPVTADGPVPMLEPPVPGALQGALHCQKE